MRRNITYGAAFGLLIALASFTMAHEEPAGALDSLTDEAELIVQGRVTNVEYGMAPKSGGSGPIPFTFVTFSVEEALKGSAAESNTVTLRFLGGQLDDKHYMVFQGVPSFDLGDEDLLFIRGNGVRGCPLVNCASGRMRVVNDQLYTDDGFEIQVNPAGQMVFGRAHALPSVAEKSIGNKRVRRVDNDDLDPAERPDPEPPSKARGEHVNKGKMKQLVANRVRSRHTPDELKRLPPVASARARERISFRGPTAEPPGREKAPPGRREQPTDPAEAAELDALIRNQGDPVLPVQAKAAVEAARANRPPQASKKN